MEPLHSNFCHIWLRTRWNGLALEVAYFSECCTKRLQKKVQDVSAPVHSCLTPSCSLTLSGSLTLQRGKFCATIVDGVELQAPCRWHRPIDPPPPHLRPPLPLLTVGCPHHFCSGPTSPYRHWSVQAFPYRSCSALAASHQICLDPPPPPMLL
jgi:hypothetical protein